MPEPITQPIRTGPGVTTGTQGPAGPPGPPGSSPIDVPIFSGDMATTDTSPQRFGSRFLDLTPFPPFNSAGLTRVIRFIVNIEASGTATANVRLRNVTDSETVSGTSLSTANLTNTQLVSSPLTVGTSSGNLKDDRMYEVEVFKSGGAADDAVTCTNARLEVTYA